MQVNML